MFQRAILALLCTTLALPGQAQRYVKPETDEPKKAHAPASAPSQPSVTREPESRPQQAKKGPKRAIIKPEPDVSREKASAPK